MSKRRSESARVVDFFETASLDVADAILGIVIETVKGRHLAGEGDEAAAPTKKRRTKAEMALEGLVPTGHLQP